MSAGKSDWINMNDLKESTKKTKRDTKHYMYLNTMSNSSYVNIHLVKLHHI